MDSLLKRLYTDLDSPASYAGVQRLYDEARKHDASVKRSDVINFLEGERIYTMHKPRRVRFPRLKIIPSTLFSDVFCDLADFQKLSRYNGGNRYMLVAVEILSRKMFAVPTKGKQPHHMIEAFDILWDQMGGIRPFRLTTDRGLEFCAKQMKDYFRNADIDKRESYNPEVKASAAERAIRTIKGRLYKYFSEKHTLDWTSALPKLLEGINNSKCRSTGMAPNEITVDNWQQVWDRLYGKHVKRNRTDDAPLKSGDSVRIAKGKEAFEKGYLPLWTDEIFRVKRRIPTRPVTFEVRDQNDELMKGRYYAQHLAKTKPPEETTHRIAKVHRTRINDGKKELLVSFVGFDPYLRSWICEDQLV